MDCQAYICKDQVLVLKDRYFFEFDDGLVFHK
jgi:hypothetical protein